MKRYCELSGDTPDAIQKKAARGIWLEGLHFKTAPDGARWINTQAVDDWVESGGQQVKLSRALSTARTWALDERRAMDEKRLAVVSAFGSTVRRVTRASNEERNRQVACTRGRPAHSPRQTGKSA